MLDAAHFTVPYAKHPHFVGREEDLARLHAALQGEGPVGINPAALGNPTGVTGQGGIGKTQLAVAYAYRYQNHYPDGIYWLNAAENLRYGFAGLGRHLLGRGGDQAALKIRIQETLRTRFNEQEIRELCAELGVQHEEFPRTLPLSALAREMTEYFDRRVQLTLLETAIRRLRDELAQPRAQDELIAHAFAWLRQHPHSLLILDNLAEPATLDGSLMRDCIPSALPSRLLFTTRRRDLGRFRPVELKTLPPDAALVLLLRDPRRTPALVPAHPEHATARDICAVFGYLPLALEIAAAHLAKKRTRSLADYRQELRLRGALDVVADPHIDVQVRHETGLMAALATQWAALSGEARMLLRVAGQLPEADYIPAARLGLLAGLADHGGGFFAVTQSDALLELDDTSLVEELTGDTVRLHPLVREFAHAKTPHDERESFCAECLQRLLTAFSDIQTLEWQCDQRGIDALVNDLLSLQSLANESPGVSNTILYDLRAYLMILQREAHNLRNWQKNNAPTFLAQQLHNRLVYSNMPALFGDLPTYLQTRGPAWQARWAARSEPASLKMTLTGHLGLVNAIAVVPDGQWAVSGSYDRTLKVWDLTTGQVERTLVGHEGPVYAVAVTPDGRWAVSGSEDRTLKVWDLATGQMERTLAGHEMEVTSVAVTSDARWVVSGSSDSTLRVWSLATGRMELTLTGHKGLVHAVAITPDGRRIVSGSSDNTLRVWSLATGLLELTLTGHKDSVYAVAITPDGRRAVSGSSDGTLRVWDLLSGQLESVLAGHEDWVRCVAVTSDGYRAVSGSRDDTLRIWNLNKGHIEWVLSMQQDGIHAVALTSDKQWVVSGSYDRTLKVRNLVTGQVELTLAGHEGSVYSVAVTPDGRRVVLGLVDDMPQVWNLEARQVERSLTGLERWIWDVVVTSNGPRAVAGSDDGTLLVWDLVKKQELARVALDDIVNCAAIIATDPVAVIASDRTGNIYGLELVEPD